jgi:16S rRNA (guanine966-N2)-methyltransferase
MRVLAGMLRGRQLAVPAGQTTRPTSGLVRGAVFNSLAARGVLDGARVADLFAGSGALGIEAISRGAARAVFVERDRAAARTIAANLEALALTDRGRIVVGPVERWEPDEVDLVLADPPYGWQGWPELLARLRPLDGVLVVVEADHPVEAEGWEVVAHKRHGGTVVSQLRARGAIST